MRSVCRASLAIICCINASNPSGRSDGRSTPPHTLGTLFSVGHGFGRMTESCRLRKKWVLSPGGPGTRLCGGYADPRELLALADGFTTLTVLCAALNAKHVDWVPDGPCPSTPSRR